MGRHIRRASSGRRLEPSSAKWSGQLWRVERYRAGRADGSPWPALNSAKRPFGGSLNAAIRAAAAERELRETVAAVKGERRRPTQAAITWQERI